MLSPSIHTQACGGSTSSAECLALELVIRDHIASLVVTPSGQTGQIPVQMTH